MTLRISYRDPVVVRAGLLILSIALSVFYATATAQAQWQIDADAKKPSEPPSETNEQAPSVAPPELVISPEQAAAWSEFEAAKCSNGGSQTRAFIDFSTQEPNEMAYVESIAQQFSQAMQQHSLAPDLSRTSVRSVQFMFELDRNYAVTSITVFAPEDDAVLKPFVVDLITKAAPYPSFDAVVEPCFQSVVISAIFDF